MNKPNLKARSAHDITSQRNLEGDGSNPLFRLNHGPYKQQPNVQNRQKKQGLLPRNRITLTLSSLSTRSKGQQPPSNPLNRQGLMKSIRLYCKKKSEGTIAIVIGLFRANFTFSHISREWRAVRMEPKYFRPVSLTSLILETY